MKRMSWEIAVGRSGRSYGGLERADQGMGLVSRIRTYSRGISRVLNEGKMVTHQERRWWFRGGFGARSDAVVYNGIHARDKSAETAAARGTSREDMSKR